MTVNVYTYANVNGPKKKQTGYGYVLECETSKGPATLSHIGSYEKETQHRAELRVIIEALKKLNKPSSLVIYTSPYMWTAFSVWMPFWIKNGWKNRKGKEIDELFKEARALLEPHKYLFYSSEHSYTEWLIRESKKEEERCLKNMESLTKPKSLPKQSKTK